MQEAEDEPLFAARAAGIDIAKAGIEVTIRVPSDTRRTGRQQETRSFRTTRKDLLAVADGLSAGPSATQIADCGAHLALTSRRCRFCLPAADASATTRPAQCPILGF